MVSYFFFRETVYWNLLGFLGSWDEQCMTELRGYGLLATVLGRTKSKPAAPSTQHWLYFHLGVFSSSRHGVLWEVERGSGLPLALSICPSAVCSAENLRPCCWLSTQCLWELYWPIAADCLWLLIFHTVSMTLIIKHTILLLLSSGSQWIQPSNTTMFRENIYYMWDKGEQF